MSCNWLTANFQTTKRTKIADLNFTVEIMSSVPDDSIRIQSDSPIPKPVLPNGSPKGGSSSSSSPNMIVSYKKSDPENVTFNVGETEKCTLKIGGMTCASCVNNIEKNISKVHGVNSILVSLMSGRGNVTFFPDIISAKQISDAVEDLGFDSEVLTIGNDSSAEILKLTITGMTCSSCVRKIETTLEKMNGIEKAAVALTTSSATIHYEREVITARAIIEKIIAIGFGAEIRNETDNANMLEHTDAIRKENFQSLDK